MKYAKAIILLVFFLVSLCTLAQIGHSEFLSFDFELPQKTHSDSLEFHVNRIAQKNEVHSQFIGRSGINSSSYESFESLRDHLTTDELFGLLQHDSLPVRVYAFLAITSNDSSLKKVAWSEFKGKKQKAMYLNGCIGSYLSAKKIIKHF